MDEAAIIYLIVLGAHLVHEHERVVVGELPLLGREVLEYLDRLSYFHLHSHKTFVMFVV